MGITLSGVGSGFDWATLVDQLRQAETTSRVTPLTTQKSKYQDKLTAWTSLASKLSTLQTAADNLKESSDLSLYKASLTSSSSTSADSLLSVTTNTGATTGNYSIQVNHLAKSQKIQSDSAASQDTDAGWTGSITLEGHEITLDGKSLQTLRNEINALNSGTSASGVSATILKTTDSDYRLILTHDATGATGMSLTDDAVGHYFSIEDPENPGTYILDTLQAGIDAEFSIDGITMTRSSNTVSDAISGLTLTLKSEDMATTVTLDVTRDTDAVKAKIQTFVDAYNQVLDYYDQQMTYDATKSKAGGALFGDNTLKSIKTNMQLTLLSAGLSDSGITVNGDNRLELDSDKLVEALQTDPNGTVSLFNDMAQNLYNSLNTATDSIDGTVTVRQNGLNASIEQVTKRITAAEELISRKMELLTTQYSNLDAALTQMQSQLTYLTTQLASLSS
jgi:flagellar hook-associated protein 2